jgi:hypothetical protein
MTLRSERPPTIIAGIVANPLRIKTINDFLKMISWGEVRRVELDSITVYRKNQIGGGSQSVIYDDEGIHKQSLEAPAIVKCALLRLSNQGTFPETEERRVCHRLFAKC